MIQVETQPERLWVPRNSKTAQAKAYFDETFGPFYRIEQIIVTHVDSPNGDNIVNGEEFNMITDTNLINLLYLQQNITKLSVRSFSVLTSILYLNDHFQIKDYIR